MLSAIAPVNVTTLSSTLISEIALISPSHITRAIYKNSLSVPDVSKNTLVPPINLSPYTTGIAASLLCLFINIPRSKSSKSVVPKSGMSGVGINHEIAFETIFTTALNGLVTALKTFLKTHYALPHLISKTV